MMTEQQIVIIGGSEGIGLAVAKAARTLGARVLAVSRTRAKLEAARDAVSGLEIRVADINNTASIQELFSELLTLDHVYIAAGSTKIGSPLDHPLNDFRHKFDERLWGSIDVVRAAYRLMRPGGSFTFTGGLSSDRPVRGAWVSGIATMATSQRNTWFPVWRPRMKLPRQYCFLCRMRRSRVRRFTSIVEHGWSNVLPGQNTTFLKNAERLSRLGPARLCGHSLASKA
jgi:NAD(P)-dependent dehydrogenase (short-subunit alcohol dehydrogenase family)